MATDMALPGGPPDPLATPGSSSPATRQLGRFARVATPQVGGIRRRPPRHRHPPQLDRHNIHAWDMTEAGTHLSTLRDNPALIESYESLATDLRPVGAGETSWDRRRGTTGSHTHCSIECGHLETLTTLAHIVRQHRDWYLCDAKLAEGFREVTAER